MANISWRCLVLVDAVPVAVAEGEAALGPGLVLRGGEVVGPE